MEIIPTKISHSEVLIASTKPQQAAMQKKIIAAFRTAAAVASPDATKRIGPTRSESVPRTPSE